MTRTLSAVARDTLDGFERDYWHQYTTGELRRELSDWKREMKESAGQAAREAEKNIKNIEKEIAARSGDGLASVARDALAHFGGDPSLERRFSGGDSLFARAKDALDAGGAVFEQDGGMWYCSWNGATYGPFPNRAAAMERRMVVSAANASGRDSLADLVDRARGGIREQVGDAWNNVKQFGRYRLLEGTATNGGEWRVMGPHGYDATFSNRAMAESQAQRESDIRPDGQNGGIKSQVGDGWKQQGRGLVKQWTVAELDRFDAQYNTHTGEKNKAGWYYQYSREDAPIGPFASESAAEKARKAD